MKMSIQFIESKRAELERAENFVKQAPIPRDTFVLSDGDIDSFFRISTCLKKR